MLSSVLSATNLSQEIKGQLIGIQVNFDKGFSEGLPVEYLIQIKAANNLDYTCTIQGLKFIKDVVGNLGLPSELRFKLQSGRDPLTPGENSKLQNLELYVIGQLLNTTNSNIANNRLKLGNLILDYMKGLPKESELDSRYLIPTSEDWPEADQYLPFIPIRVPVPKNKPYTRIGYAVFDNPVNYVSQSRTTQIEQIPAMRLAGTIKKGVGKAYESYTLTYIAQGEEEISKSVKDVFEQISLTPFTTVEGGPFGDRGSQDCDIKHQAIAVRNFSVSTIDGFPNALQVEISFDPFNWQYYVSMSDNQTNPVMDFDDILCWPLIKVWSKRAERSTYSGESFNGKFSLYFPSESGAALIDQIFSQKNTLLPFSDESTLESFQNILSSEEGAKVTSREIKEIQDPNSTVRVFVLKVSSKALFDAYVNSEFCWGLTTWDKLSASNLYDHLGHFLPESSLINPGYFTQLVSGFVATQGQTDFETKLNRYIDIPKQITTEKIRTYLQNTTQNSLTVVEGASDPQNLFGIVLYSTDLSQHERLKAFTSHLANTTKVQEIESFETRDTQIKKSLLSQKNGIDTALPVIETGEGGVDEDILIERIGGSRGHNLATLSLRRDPLPVHQYMGGMDATIIVQGKCFGIEAKRKLEHLKEEFDNRAISKKSNKFNISIDQARKGEAANTSFLFVDNEIFHLLGVQFAMPVTLQFGTLDQQPGVWSFTLTFIEYNPDLKRAEEIKFLNTSWQKLGRIFNYGWNFSSDSSNMSQNPIIDKAIEFFEVQGELARQEIYPDLYLPTIGELRYWIRAIHKGARAWDSGIGIKSSFDKNRTQPLTSREKEIVNIVAEQFYPESSTKIVRFWDSSQPIFQGSESSAFAEPDFYAWYHPNESFGNIFDKLTEHQMGKRNQNFSAEGRAASGFNGTRPTGMYREYDPEYGLSAVYNTEWYSANAAKYPIDGQLNNIMERGLFPEARANKAREAVKNAETSLDETEGAWWTRLQQKYALSKTIEGKDTFVLSEQQISTMSEVYSFFSDPVNAANLIPVKSGEMTPYLSREILSDFEKYFTIDWRQKALKDATSRLAKFQITQSYLRACGDNNTKFYLRDEDILKNFNLEESDMSDLENALRIDIKAFTGDFSEKQTAPLTTQKIFMLNGDFREDPPWVIRSALISAGFRNYVPRSLSISDTGIDGIYQNWSDIDSIALEHEIDPHIIRAVFLRRDGFGLFKPSASPDSGFGDFSISGNSAQVLMQWCESYNKYAKDLYNIPSLVLLCLNLRYTEIAKEYRDYNGEIKESVLDAIRSTADICHRKRFSETTRFAIAELLNKYPEAGNTIDQYYAAYISMCRIFGSYDNIGMDKWRDPFFHGYNLLTLIDTETNQELIISRFCPTNNPAGVGISMSRGDATQIYNDPFAQKIAEGYDKNSSSLDLEAALSMKMRGAIDPHSECALYGSLVDFRTHAPIGKLRGAFPSFQILLTNEGFFWSGGSKKLWDQFYTRTGVSSIEVHKSRHMPGATASVTFSNMFHNITAYALMEAIADKSARDVHEQIGNQIRRANFFGMISEIWNMLLIKNVPEDARKIWQNNQLKRLALSAGTRIQIRMGYGSNAAKLPIVFNGTVIDAPVSDGYVTLTAVSDGHQLEKPTTTKLIGAGSSYAFQDGGAFGTGSDPSLIIKHALIAATWWDNVTGGNFRDHSSGISNFGEVIFEGALRYSAEVEFNIYTARKTKIESGIREIFQYNLVNGIVNWENERNLFSVSVQEPTPWKVMEVCRRACSDFVAAAEPFALRSTVFFGKWWWPYHFTYDKSILKLYVNPNIISVTSAGGDISKAPDGSKSVVKVGDGPAVQLLQVYYEPYPGGASYIIHLSNNTFYFIDVQSGPPETVRQTLQIQTLEEATRRSFGKIQPNYPRAEVDKVREEWSNFFNIHVKGKFGTHPSAQVITEALTTTPEKTEGVSNQTRAEIQRLYFNDQTLQTNLDHLKDVNTLQLHLRWKPYMQAYIAHSGINLLDNNIRADGTKVVTDAIGMHQYNGYLSSPSVSKTIAYSLDTDIHPTDRKTMMVDTGIMLTGLQAGTEAFAGGILGTLSKIPVLGEIFQGASNYVEETPTTPAIENAVVTALIDQVKEMYQGWFTIQGIASVKPRDLFLLTDHITDLRGPVFVKDVVHRMDAQTGFITMVSPDAVVLPHDSIIGQQMITSLTTGALHRIGSFLIMKGAAAGLIQFAKNKWLYSSYNGTLSKNFRQYKKIQANLNLTDELNDLKARSLNRIDKDIANAQAQLRRLGVTEDEFLDAFNGKSTTTRDGLNAEALKAKIKKLKEQREKLRLLDVNKNPDEVLNVAKYLNIIQSDSDISRRLSVANRLKSKMDAFEAQLEEKIKQMRKIKSTSGEKIPGINFNWSDSEIEEAIARWADQARAEFIAENIDDVEAVLNQLNKDTDLANDLQELIAINKRLSDSRTVGVLTDTIDASKGEPVLGVVESDELRREELIKKINRRIKNYEILEGDIDAVDTTLRRLFNFEPVIFADGKRVSALKAAWEGITSTPGALIKGSAALIKGIWDEIFKGWHERKAALELLGNPKAAWMIPSPIIKLLGDLKKLEQDLKKDTLAATEKILSEATAAGKVFSEAEKAKILADAASEARKAKQALILNKLTEAVQNSITGIRLLKYMGPQALLSLAVDAAILLIGNSFIEGHNARLRARQCAKIIPLRAGEIPYTAGIKGHQGAVIGDNPSWVDELISGLHGVQNDVLSGPGVTLLMFFAAINGVEVPEYGRTEIDTAYLNELRKTEGGDMVIQ